MDHSRYELCRLSQVVFDVIPCAIEFITKYSEFLPHFTNVISHFTNVISHTKDGTSHGIKSFNQSLFNGEEYRKYSIYSIINKDASGRNTREDLRRGRQGNRRRGWDNARGKVASLNVLLFSAKACFRSAISKCQ